jgi:hypothetical protein
MCVNRDVILSKSGGLGLGVSKVTLVGMSLWMFESSNRSV